MNRTIGEAAVWHCRHSTHRQFETPRDLMPYKFICKACADHPRRFATNPRH